MSDKLKKANDNITKYMKLAKKKKVNNMTDINKTLSEIKSFVMSDAIAASYQNLHSYRNNIIDIANYCDDADPAFIVTKVSTDCLMREYRSKLLYEIKKIEESLK